MLTDSVGQESRNATVGIVFLCSMKDSKSCSVVSPQVHVLEKSVLLETVALIIQLSFLTRARNAFHQQVSSCTHPTSEDLDGDS